MNRLKPGLCNSHQCYLPIQTHSYKNQFFLSNPQNSIQIKCKETEGSGFLRFQWNQRTARERTWEKRRVKREKKGGDGVKRTNDLINVLRILYSWYHFCDLANHCTFQLSLLLWTFLHQRLFSSPVKFTLFRQQPTNGTTLSDSHFSAHCSDSKARMRL